MRPFLDLKAECTARTYSVEIPEDKFLALLESEKPTHNAGEYLDVKLSQRGAFKVDYNGHFGTQIIFSLDEDDLELLVDMIDIIEDHLERL